MADKIEGLSIGLDLESTKVERGLTGLKDKLKTANAEMKNTMSAFDRSDQSIEKYETRLKGLNKKLQTQEQVTQAAKEKHEQLIAEGKEGTEEAERAKRAYNKESAELNNLSRYVNNATEELEEMKRQQKIANSTWTKSGKKLTAMGDKISSVGGKVTGFGKKWSKMSGLAVGAITGLGTTIFGLTNKISANADEVQSQAAEMGVAAETYQELDYWAQQNNISQQAFHKIAGRLNQRMGEAKNGNEKYQKALEGVGVSMQEVKQGTIDTEEAFARSIKTLSETENEQDKVSKATELFGKKTARQLLPALQEGSLSMKEAKEQAHELGIVMSDEQIEASQKFQAGMDKIKAGLKGATQELGLSLLPYMQKAQDWVMGNMPQIKETVKGAFDSISSGIKSIVTWFQNINPEIKKAVGLFAGIAAAIGPVSIAIGSLVKVFGPFVGVIGKALTGIGKLGGLLPVLKGAFAALTGPVGLTVGVITAVASGFTLAYKKSETFRNAIGSVVEQVKNFASQIKPLIMDAVDTVIGFMKQIGGSLKQFWKDNSDVITDAIKNIWTVVQPVVNAVLGIFQAVFPLILQVVKSVWNNIKGVIQGGLDVILGLVKTFAGLFSGNFSKMWEGVKQIFSGAIKFIWNFIQLQFFGKILKGAKALLTSFTGVVKSMWGGIKSIFTNFIKTIVGFVKKRFNAMKDTVGSIFDSVKTITKTAWNKVKSFIIDPIKSGVKWSVDKFNSFKSTVSGIFNRIKESISDKVGGMIQFVKDMPGKMARGIKKGARAIKRAAKKIANKLLSPIRGAINKITDGIGWVLSKVGASDIGGKFKDYSAPAFAKGTDGHKEDGPAIVGDGKGSNAGREMITRPNGESFLSPAKPTLMPMEKGTQVTPAKITKQITGAPRYAEGTGWLSTAWNKIKSFGSDVGKFITNPIKSIKGAISKFVNLDNMSGIVKNIASGAASKIVESGKDWFKDKITGGGVGEGVGSSDDVKRWIATAIQVTNSPNTWAKPLNTIAMKESGGRTGPETINTWDINAKRGHPSMGLMQTIRPTFEAHKKNGMDDIMNPVHNAVAAINYIKSRYGNPFNVPGIKALRQGKSYVGYEDGTNYVPQTGFAMLHKGEAVIPADQNKKRTDAMKLLAMIGNNIGGQTGGVAVADDSKLEDTIIELSEKVDDMTNLLAKILKKDNNVYLDPEEISRKTYKHDIKFQNKDEVKEARGRGDL